MHGYFVHKALYQNYEIHGPWVKDSSPRAEKIRPDNENVLILKKLLLCSIIYLRKTKCVIMMYMKPWVKDSGPREGQIWPCM